tara:strand:- start:404 stop:649 length:246 start_codon:yes stop_codon:yes gene_type:complete
MFISVLRAIAILISSAKKNGGCNTAPRGMSIESPVGFEVLDLALIKEQHVEPEVTSNIEDLREVKPSKRSIAPGGISRWAV